MRTYRRKDKESWVVRLLGYTLRFATHDEYSHFHEAYVNGRYPTRKALTDFIERAKGMKAKREFLTLDNPVIKV